MTAKDKSEPGKTKTETPAIRDLQKDEIDSVSGGAGSKPPSWIEPDTEPVHDPKSPGWVDPDTQPVR
jgi:hypothetical protein